MHSQWRANFPAISWPPAPETPRSRWLQAMPHTQRPLISYLLVRVAPPLVLRSLLTGIAVGIDCRDHFLNLGRPWCVAQ